MTKRVVVLISATLAATLALGVQASQASLVVESTLEHVEPLYSLAHPDYGTSDTSVLESLAKATSASVGSVVSEPRRTTAPDVVDPLLRDCTKEALGDVGWDIYWAVANGASFELEPTARGVVEGCLETYLGSQIDVSDTAIQLARAITSGAERVYEHDSDLYGVADWMLVEDYYYIPY